MKIDMRLFMKLAIFVFLSSLIVPAAVTRHQNIHNIPTALLTEGQPTDVSVTASPPSAVQTKEIQATTPHVDLTKVTVSGADVNMVKLANDTLVRTEPGTRHMVILHAEAGSAFPLLYKGNEWWEVRIGSNQTGWIPATAAQEKNVSATARGQVNVRLEKGAKLYQGPDETFRTVGRVNAGQVYQPRYVSGQWVKLSGMDGWVKLADASAWEAVSQTASASADRQVHILSTATLPLTGKTIVLDAGHGGKDKGAITEQPLVYERDVNLIVAQVLQAKLVAAGANVVMTRESNDQDVTLQERADISNKSRADAFISIHQNIFEGDANISGTITFYQHQNSIGLAKAVGHPINRSLHGEEQGAKVVVNNLHVLRNNERPAILVEGCFLSNPQERKESMLPTFHEQLATGIYHGLIDYFQGDN